MSMPTTWDLNLPILQQLEQGSMTTKELEGALAMRFQLTEDERRQKKNPSAPQTVFLNRILWSVGAVMGDGGLVTKMSARSGKNVYGITDFGRSVLAVPPSVIDHDWLCEHCPSYEAKYGRSHGKKSGVSPIEPPIQRPVPDGVDATDALSYGVDSILSDGCFLPKPDIEEALKLLTERQNLVLQGPPGTGKTWLAKRLGYALLGERNSERLLAIQFHPSLSYEDFVRGLRFSKEEAGLALTDGVFLELTDKAKRDPEQKYVLVIEEINRGNPSQIFGELLTLLESDKRGPDEWLRLAYPRQGERFYIPANLYIVGTMNLADRSLALIDFALRRRFAFFELEPRFDDNWTLWCQAARMPSDLLKLISDRFRRLNGVITDDRTLGRQFCIGHSFVTPKGEVQVDWRAWFRRVIKREIEPLLREYWYDNDSVATAETERLLEGF